MRNRDLRYVFGSSGLAMLLAACNGMQNQATPSFALPPNATRAALPARAASWMSPGAKKTDLLYVSDNKGRIYVFSYPSGQRVGLLAGFNGAAGMCSDGKGNVFVANTGDGNILEFAHGGTQPIATLLEFGEFPNGCSVDPTTGNLAVTNYSSNPAGPGSVAIYAGARGSPTMYTATNFSVYLFCSYDGKGNLYIDGLNSGTTHPLLAVLPSGTTTFTNVTLDKSVGFPGAIQWDGKYVALEDVYTDTIDQISITGSGGAVVGSTHLSARSNLLVQFWIQGQTVIVPYGMLSRHVKKVGLWSYPGGGSPTKVLTKLNSTELFGATVSVAKD